MMILAIETSCDETAISVVEAKDKSQNLRFRILSNVIASQAKIHRLFGGVVPNLAKREHQRNLVLILETALKEARLLKSKIKNQKLKLQFKNKKLLPSILYNLQAIMAREPELLKQFMKKVLPLKKPKIDAIAVTVGPGLEPALWVGINFAKALAYLWNKPIIGVNHLEGHLASVLLTQNRRIPNSEFLISKPRRKAFGFLRGRQIPNSKFRIPKIEFPAIALLVSGGHTQLVLIKDWLKYKVIGETLDDAAGEAFDKVARLLNLGYPGGPAIGLEAEKYKETFEKLRLRNIKINLPRPMLNSKDYNFSFSGLKTAVLYLLKDLEINIPNLYESKDVIGNISTEFQEAVVEVLIKKTLGAAREYKAKSVILAGGVAANKKLRETLGRTLEKNIPGALYFLPEPEFTGDNAAMIAAVSYFYIIKNQFSDLQKIKADANLKLKQYF